jgi:hypothetical protein
MLAHWAESVLFRNKSNNACKHIFGSIENTKKKQKKNKKKKKRRKKTIVFIISLTEPLKEKINKKRKEKRELPKMS